MQQQGFELTEDPFDVLCNHQQRNPVLIEVKSLDGTADDEKAQVRSALAQLLYYAAFDVGEPLQARRTIKAAVFELEISEEHRRFLQGHGCVVLWRVGGGFEGIEQILQANP